MSGLLGDLIWFATVAALATIGVRQYLRQRRIVVNTPEAADDLLDAVFTHWVIHSQLEHGTATRMRAELRDHFADVLGNGGRLDDVVGPDVTAFADEWASTHGAPGPWAGLVWRVASNASLLFGIIMMHRTIDLLGDGLAEVGFLVGVILAVLFALPVTLSLPWLSRLSNPGQMHTQFQRFLVFLPLATGFIFLVGWALKDLLRRSDYSFDPQPGRWWVSALMILGALAVGLLADGLPRRHAKLDG